MAKKQRTQKKCKQPVLSWKQRYNKAQEQIAAKNYANALAELKAIWKVQKDGLVKKSLSFAYVERAKQLAQKGLYKEAGLLLEGSHRLNDALTHLDLTMHWLLRAGAAEKALKFYNQHSAELNHGPHYYPVLEHLALRLLDDGFLPNSAGLDEILPQDDFLLKHREQIKHALAKYAAKQDGAALALLACMPYRSPYRYLILALKALISVSQNNDIQKAENYLRQIPESSMLFQMAQLIQALLTPARLLSTLTNAEIDVLLDLKNIDKQRKALFKKISALPSCDHPQVIMLLIRHHDLFPNAVAKKLAFPLLVDNLQEIQDYEHAFGPLSAEKKAHLHALATLQSGNVGQTIAAWKIYLSLLEAEKLQTPVLKLKQAFVMRYIAKAIEKTLTPDCGCYSCQEKQQDCLRLLHKSLALDPQDKPSYMQLIKQYKGEKSNKSKNNKTYQHLVDQLLKTFPQDPDALRATVDRDVDNKKYPQALKWVQQWLALDPINPTVKNLRLTIQLAQIKTWAQQNKPKNVAQAQGLFEDIERMDKTAASNDLLIINKALFHLLQGSAKEKSMETLKNYFLTAENRLALYCQILLEAASYGIDPKQLGGAFDKLLKERKERKSADLLLAFQRLRSYKAQILAAPLKAGLKKIQQLLAVNTTLNLPKDAYLQITDILLELKCYVFAESYAVYANKQFNNEPLLIYNLLVAQCENDPQMLQGKRLTAMERAHHLAEKQNDSKALQLIGRFLDLSVRSRGEDRLFLQNLFEGLLGPGRRGKKKLSPFL